MALEQDTSLELKVCASIEIRAERVVGAIDGTILKAFDQLATTIGIHAFRPSNLPNINQPLHSKLQQGLSVFMLYILKETAKITVTSDSKQEAADVHRKP